MRPRRSYWTLAERLRTEEATGRPSRTFWRPNPDRYGRHPSKLAAIRAYLEARDPLVRRAPDERLWTIWRGRQGKDRSGRALLRPAQCSDAHPQPAASQAAQTERRLTTMRWEQILGSTLYWQITGGRTPANKDAPGEIEAGWALIASPDADPMDWGSSPNQQALGAAVAWFGNHPRALPAVERLLSRELNVGVFGQETLSSYGQFNLGALEAILAAQPECIPRLDRDQVRLATLEALRRHWALVAFFSCRRAHGLVRYAAPAPREHGTYHEGIDVALCELLGLQMSAPRTGSRWEDNNPRRSLALNGIKLLRQQGLEIFSAREVEELRFWVLGERKVPSEVMLSLLGPCRCAIPTEVRVYDRGLFAYQLDQGLVYDDPRPAVASLRGAAVAQLRATDPEAPFTTVVDDKRVEVASGLYFWPGRAVQASLDYPERDMISASFVGEEGTGREASGKDLDGRSIAVPPFRRSTAPFKTLDASGIGRSATETFRHFRFDREGAWLDGRPLSHAPDWKLSRATKPPSPAPAAGDTVGIRSTPAEARLQATRTAQRLASQFQVLAGMVEMGEFESALAALGTESWRTLPAQVERIGNLIRRAAEATPLDQG